MAYSQLYDCDRLAMIYPHHAGFPATGVQASYGIAVPGQVPAPRLQIATVVVALPPLAMAESLTATVLKILGFRIVPPLAHQAA